MVNTQRSVFRAQIKNHAAASLLSFSLSDLMKGVEGTRVQLHPPSGTFVPAQLLPGDQSHEKYQLCPEERCSHHFCRVGMRGDNICQQPPDGPKGGRRIRIHLRILPTRVFCSLNWELVDEREPGEEELG